jgi:hypothetical protein
MFIHGHNEQAEELVDGIEREVERETGERLEPVEQEITILGRRQRRLPDRQRDLPDGDPRDGAGVLLRRRHRHRRRHRPGPVRQLVETGKEVNVFYGYLIASLVMIAAGAAEWLLGVDAERRSLEDIAAPLTAEEDRAEASP